MVKYESPVMNAVAYPPTMLFAPVELAAMNAVFNVIFMALSQVIFPITPLTFLITAIIGHAVIVAISFRDPHLVTLLRSSAPWPRKTRNLVPGEGAKYVP